MKCFATDCLLSNCLRRLYILTLSRIGIKTLSTCGIAGAALLAGLLCIAVRAEAPKRAFELQGISPPFWNLVDRNAQLATVASGFGFTEGPVWDKAGYLWVSDEVTNQLFQVNLADGKKHEVMALGDPDGNTYDKQQRLLDCASVLRAVIRLSPDGKSYDILADHYQGKRLNSPNDVVLGPDGAIYFTDPISDLPAGQKQEIPFKGVYRISKDGQVQLLTKELTEPNGLAFSPDGKSSMWTIPSNGTSASTTSSRMALWPMDGFLATRRRRQRAACRTA